MVGVWGSWNAGARGGGVLGDDEGDWGMRRRVARGMWRRAARCCGMCFVVVWSCRRVSGLARSGAGSLVRAHRIAAARVVRIDSAERRRKWRGGRQSDGTQRVVMAARGECRLGIQVVVPSHRRSPAFFLLAGLAIAPPKHCAPSNHPHPPAAPPRPQPICGGGARPAPASSRQPETLRLHSCQALTTWLQPLRFPSSHLLFEITETARPRPEPLPTAQA
ncbi:hypothetical protein B0J12DRAFT_180207 [Macrophomina phaseolina]|uniref:Uncharacterized protein n=1 Tax=Macrophomina phaseolina TaxID=35725 RepID=A0ABQ8G4A4_9PEZI|nr:hypothetical protein B0J12DRAFT_180207 [Macrophomina phaseolina]